MSETSMTTTKVVVVAANTITQPAALVEQMIRARAAGAEIAVVCNFDPESLSIGGELASFHQLDPRSPEYSRSLRRALAAASRPQRVWLLVERNRAVRRLLKDADVIVALDANAVHAVWELAQRHRRPAAVFGMAAAIKAVSLHQADPGRADRGRFDSARARTGVWYRQARQFGLVTGVSMARSALSPAVMRTRPGQRLWTATLAAPKVPDGVRRRMAFAVHSSLLRADRPGAAVVASARAVGRIKDGPIRADLLLREAAAEIKYGEPPSLKPAVAASLALTDSYLTTKAETKVAPIAYRAMRLLFSASLHVNSLTSTLAEQPESYLSEWHNSATGQKMAAPRGRSMAVAGPVASRPHRVAIVINSSDDEQGENDRGQVAEIIRRLDTSDVVELRVIDIAEHDELAELALLSRRMIEHLAVGKSIYANRVESLIRPHLEWADTVLVEGARAGAALVSLVDPGSTRVVVRMHYADLLNYWPQLIDFTRVGDVIFDAPHVRDFAVRVVPRLAGAQHPPLHVIAGAISAGMPALPKPDDARFTLAVIGVGAMATDPRWSVAVLRHLHERDQRYRLLLVGDGLNTGPAKINAYEDLLSRDIAELNGAVHRRSQHSDLSRLIAEVGVILNGSVRDGFPYAVIDGAASGAIPVVRDWPLGSAQDNGARTLLPADWVVDSAEQAAERILKLTSSNDVWREAGEITSRQVRDLWDRTAELEAFDAVLLGQGSAD